MIDALRSHSQYPTYTSRPSRRASRPSRTSKRKQERGLCSWQTAARQAANRPCRRRRRTADRVERFRCRERASGRSFPAPGPLAAVVAFPRTRALVLRGEGERYAPAPAPASALPRRRRPLPCPCPWSSPSPRAPPPSSPPPPSPPARLRSGAPGGGRARAEAQEARPRCGVRPVARGLASAERCCTLTTCTCRHRSRA